MNDFIKPVKASARAVYEQITKGSEQVAIDEAVHAALVSLYENARLYQIGKGRQFDVSLDYFLKLATPLRRRRMGDKMRTGNFDRFMASNSGYVVGWKNREAYKSGIMNNDTVALLNRTESKRRCQFSNGDTHTEEARAAIGNARRGKKMDDATKAKISVSKQGTEVSAETREKLRDANKGKPKSEEQKQRMREAALARHAAARAAKP